MSKDYIKEKNHEVKKPKPKLKVIVNNGTKTTTKDRD